MANKLSWVIGVIVFVLLLFSKYAFMLLLLSGAFGVYVAFKWLIWKSKQGGTE